MIVELGRARALVSRHLLCVLERASVREIGGDPGRAERVTADRFGDAGGHSAPADHPPGIWPGHGLGGKHLSVVTPRRAEQPSFAVLGDAGRIDIGVQGFGERVVDARDSFARGGAWYGCETIFGPVRIGGEVAEGATGDIAGAEWSAVREDRALRRRAARRGTLPQ